MWLVAAVFAGSAINVSIAKTLNRFAISRSRNRVDIKIRRHGLAQSIPMGCSLDKEFF
jgi:hypothetical protein